MVNVAFIAAKSAYHLEDDGLTEEARNTTISNLLHFDKSYAYTFAPKLDHLIPDVRSYFRDVSPPLANGS